MEKYVKKLLNKFEMQPNWLGYKMWVTAIKLKLENETKYEKMGGIYVDVAKKHKSTYVKVERAMRYALNEGNTEEKIRKYFKVNYKITNGIF